MSWNGSGSFNRLFSWVADKAAGLNISSTRMDSDSNDIASNGFGNCLTRDGQGIATANLGMGGFRHTNVGNGVASTDYAALGQLTNYTKDVSGLLVTTGTSTAYAVTANETISSTPADGQLIVVSLHTANGASATLAANGGTAFPLQLVPGIAVPANTIDASVPIPLKFSLSASAWILFSSGVSAFALSVNNSAVNNAGLANAGAWTLKGNNTGSSAAPQDFTIASLTGKSPPASGDEIPIWDVAGAAMKRIFISDLAVAMSGGLAPTVQRFTSGTSLTYTPTAGFVRIKVRMCGGGGGGGGRSSGAGGNGGNSSFGSWATNGGLGGATSAFGQGGQGNSGGANGTGTLIVRINGGSGQGGMTNGGGSGGVNPFGGGGGGANGGGSVTTVAPNTGAGGGGGNAGASAGGGGGGGAGEYVEFWMTAAQVGVSQTYTVGGAGTAGDANSGAGAAGIIIIEEFYI